MSIESYAVHIAPRGGKIDQIVDSIAAARQAAHNARLDYAHSKGALAVYASDSNVEGLVFKEDAPLPEGWSKKLSLEAGVVAAPKARDRTKAEREATKARQRELFDLPSLPGAASFTSKIGGNQTITANPHGRGFAMLNCWYERVGEITFVMTPWGSKRDETGNLNNPDTGKTAFHPEGCERVGLSAYYAAKEAAQKAA